MAFIQSNLVKWSVNSTPNTLPPVNVFAPVNVASLWTYYAGTDNIAAVTAANYFQSFAGFNGGADPGGSLKINDLIWCVCSDGYEWASVTAISPVITTAISDGTIPANTITTAMIQNQAVTAAKIANSTITATQIAAAANILGSQLSAAAGIVGTQLANNTITGTQIANTTITSAQIANNTITATQLALSVPQNVRVTLSSAAFVTAYTAGLQIIPAAGAGTIINVLNYTLTFNYLTASYTAGGAMGLQYSTIAPLLANGIAASATIPAASLTGLSAQGFQSAAGALAINGAAGLVNAGVWFTVATQNFATGSGTVTVNATYNVITV